MECELHIMETWLHFPVSPALPGNGLCGKRRSVKTFSFFPILAAPVLCALLFLPGCRDGNSSDSHASHIPGGEKSLKTKALEAGAELTQSEGPISAIHQHVCGFHFYAGEPERQVRAHHFCAHPTEDVLQCVIFDSNERNARLIGIEYIISEKLFNALPEEEKKLWHSHRHEVKSGQLIAPGVPEAAERELMKKLVNTYGKTWHTWQVDRGDALPLGIPQLMMAPVEDGLISPALIAERDEYLGTDTNEKRRSRADIPDPAIAPGADAWRNGETFQLELKRLNP